MMIIIKKKSKKLFYKNFKGKFQSQNYDIKQKFFDEIIIENYIFARLFKIFPC